MAHQAHITRRSALATISGAAASVTALSPALGKALRGSADANDIDTQLNILFEQFNRDARIIDPSISEAVIMRDLTVPNRDPRGALAAVSFSRGEHGLIRQVSRPTDDELLRLIEEHQEARMTEEAAWDVARPLTAKAKAEFDALGIGSLDDHWDTFSAIHDAVGASAAEDIAEAASERERELFARVRDCPPRTLGGLMAKFEFTRKAMGIDDTKPRADQDMREELFNVFGDDLRALVA